MQAVVSWLALTVQTGCGGSLACLASELWRREFFRLQLSGQSAHPSAAVPLLPRCPATEVGSREADRQGVLKMNRITMLLAATFLATGVTAAASAKTLVYCSEGSPEGFDVSLYTSGTTFDAGSKTVYNRPGRVRAWNHEPGSSARGELGSLRTTGSSSPSICREGVKFHSTDWFTPTRDFNADDVVFSFKRQLSDDHPWHEYVAGAAWEYFDGMDMPTILKDVVKVDDLTVKFVLNRPEAPMVANSGHGLRLHRLGRVRRPARGVGRTRQS